MSATNRDVMSAAHRMSLSATQGTRSQLLDLLGKFKLKDLNKETKKKYEKSNPSQKLSALITRIRHAPLLARWQPNLWLHEEGCTVVDSYVRECRLTARASLYKNQYEMRTLSTHVSLRLRKETEEYMFGYHQSMKIGRGSCRTAECTERPRYMILDLFGNSADEDGSASFVGDPLLRSVATITHQPSHTILPDTDLSVASGRTARDSIGTFASFEHVLYRYMMSNFNDDKQREDFVMDLLECSSKSCRPARSAKHVQGGDHVWEVQIHTRSLPFHLLNGIRSDFNGSKEDNKPKPPRKMTAKEKKKLADKKRKEEEKRKKAETQEQKRLKKEEQELDVDGRRGKRGPLGRLRTNFGSETGMRLRELAQLNKWPLAWTSKSGEGQSRIVLDMTVGASDNVGFDARCRFVTSALRTHTPAASNLVESAWKNVAGTSGDTVVAVATWDQLTADLKAFGKDYAC
jgi:hypothetical protein